MCATAPKISHLLFADDTLLLGSATLSTALEFEKILNSYCSLTGQAVNAGKSDILFGPKVPSNAKRDILHLLGHAESKALSYLGITLRPGKINIGDFNGLLDSLACKIRNWGVRHLSLARRVALINSSLSAIPAHAVSNFPVPKSVMQKINTLLNKFLWSGSIDGHSIHYARWTDICTPKQHGGLGIKNLELWKSVIMAKMARRVYAADSSLAAKTFGCKYKRGNLFIKNRSHSKIWKAISTGGDIMANHSFWMVGNGICIDTMKDNWTGFLPFDKWPTFINITIIPGRVSSLLNDDGSWSPLIFDLFGLSLIEVIQKLARDNLGGADMLCWAYTETDKMNAAAIYEKECHQPDLIGGISGLIKYSPDLLCYYGEP